MTGILYPLSRSALFKFDPEAAHGLSLSTIARVGRVPGLRSAVAALFTVSERRARRSLRLAFQTA